MAKMLRSMLYVPANSWRMVVNAPAEGADAIILDIEDGCPMAEKETGRVFARDAAPLLKEQGVELFVRVNSLDTALTETDLEYVVTPGLDGIMLAKTETAEDIVAVDKLISAQEKAKGMPEGGVSLVALIETPKGIVNMNALIAASPRVIAVAFGAGDYSREMGAGMGVSKISPDDYFPMTLYARSAMAIAARAAGIQAIDTPFFGMVIDLEGLARETMKVKLLGFSGKQLTHPRHCAPVNATFAPAPDEINFANTVVSAYEAAQKQGLGATTVGGKMIDYGSYKRSVSLLALAEAVAAREATRSA
jgi:citrate lyase subunit beta / citryl-CoA lyase